MPPSYPANPRRAPPVPPHGGTERPAGVVLPRRIRDRRRACPADRPRRNGRRVG
ncbi:hypothetical protein SNL152K_3079 [Streptomyces sp. NL15-2K]|nr:hypothetical protein SNL152K_3079 [Streptomyces sp. NL15-2K]